MKTQETIKQKIENIRNDITEQKRDQRIADLIALFGEKGEMKTLDDFEIDNPGAIWYYFYRVSLTLGFPERTIDRLFIDARDIAIEILDNPPSTINPFIMRAGKYNPDKTGYEEGYPLREQHIWHMLMWLLPEDAAEITDAIARRLERLCTGEWEVLPYYDDMKALLAGGEQKEQIPQEVDSILTEKGRECATALRKRLRSIKSSNISCNSDYLFVELALHYLQYIKDPCKHKSFLKALEAWDIIDQGYVTSNNLTNKWSRYLRCDTTRKEWSGKDRNKFDTIVEKLRNL